MTKCTIKSTQKGHTKTRAFLHFLYWFIHFVNCLWTISLYNYSKKDVLKSQKRRKRRRGGPERTIRHVPDWPLLGGLERRAMAEIVSSGQDLRTTGPLDHVFSVRTVRKSISPNPVKPQPVWRVNLSIIDHSDLLTVQYVGTSLYCR